MTYHELIELVAPAVGVVKYVPDTGFSPLTDDGDAIIAARDELEERCVTLTDAQPASSFADAYQGAMEEVAIWKKRALEAEDLNRKFIAEINGPTYMGEPVHSKPDCGEAGHDEGRCGNRQCLPGAQGEEK